MTEDFTHQDALTTPAARGRGAQLNPGNRFESVRLHVLGEHLDRVLIEEGEECQIKTEVFRDDSKRIINRVDSPDIPFRWTINPYRGCEHGCVYCYARPTHEFLGMSCGMDFETKIMAKFDAPAMLRRELALPKWRGDHIVMSGVTDPYQPVERRLGITRGILEVMAECRQPVALVTKNRLIERDIDLLTELNKYNAVHAAVSVTTLDADLARKMEPRASSPADRLAAIKALSEAGIPTMAMIAPIMPAVNDREIPALLAAVADAGAIHAGYVLLRLPYQIKDLYLDWLSRHFPDRAKRAENLLRESRDGQLYVSRFGQRMKGTGTRAEQIGRVFETFSRRYGLTGPLPSLDSTSFIRPNSSGQMGLFEV